jgi:hypothetical protein
MIVFSIALIAGLLLVSNQIAKPKPYKGQYL